ncbi:hypothetical protein GIB67_012346 [Kingdonia uniflora]|uniref:beta-galactosidase n=1 Tax=Kingdonia uniflora TaxID=39325 RepID=A0A7J7MVG7_9MAGN|nr:hypothetical protein GIB67_012346 [Kingdonia uniflora]
MWTENWTGWYKNWGGKDPSRPVGDIAYAVALFFQSGGTLTNYYMYHGGTNFGRTSGIYITTSYNYDAPLDEYGNLRQPKWGHLKGLHTAIIMLKKVLTEGNVSTTNVGVGVNATIYSANGTSGCFLSNKNATSSATVTFQGNQYCLPAWSVSILPDCKKEVYNTAKVRSNLDQAKTALEALIKREEKKREVMESEVSLQRIQMKYTDLHNLLCLPYRFDLSSITLTS